jgi:gliding motility-associated lipoprotein GldH
MKSPFAFYTLFLLGGILSLIACSDNRIFEKNTAISDGIWEVNEKPTFEILVEDTISLYHFFVNIRNTGAYAYSNLFLFLETEYPDGQLSKDTLECFLADAHGKWLGKGSGEIIDNQILFKRNVNFPQPGPYTFRFQQGMRDFKLKEIIDIGLRIEKSH